MPGYHTDEEDDGNELNAGYGMEDDDKEMKDAESSDDQLIEDGVQVHKEFEE